MNKMSFSFGRLMHYAVLIMLAVIFLFPVVWVALSSFKYQQEIFQVPMTFLPKKWTLDNYVFSFAQNNFFINFKNSLIVSVISTVITVLINTMAGYALAKYIFPGRELIFTVMLATLMIPLQVIMVPVFLQLKRFHMLNSLWGVIIPPAATPTGVFLARQYMVSLPNSMIEASRIDGASESKIFFKVIVPLSKPIIATITIFSFMWRWNDYLWPLIVITDNKLQTLQQALAGFVGQLQINWSSLLAMTSISMLPVILVFFMFQKYFMTGITAGSVKG
ncbi:MAG: carbohydrate ABC transporter permease [Christensenellales bacterium]|jgi:alpha-1,4-digalacturonate transport system permease protein